MIIQIKQFIIKIFVKKVSSGGLFVRYFHTLISKTVDEFQKKKNRESQKYFVNIFIHYNETDDLNFS